MSGSNGGPEISLRTRFTAELMKEFDALQEDVEETEVGHLGNIKSPTCLLQLRMLDKA